MKDYSAMSDFEINKEVAQHLNPSMSVVSPREVGAIAVGASASHAVVVMGCNAIWVNYCNNPADAWPIIVSNHIGIMPFKNGEAKAWPLSVGLLSSADVKHANPLRAAMIVYLQMMESQP